MDLVPRASLIVVSYNSIRDLKLFLLGERWDGTQTYSLAGDPLEVIVVDNASTDGSRGLLRKLGEEQKITYIHNSRNEGYGKALNQGIKAAKSELIIASNADIEVVRPDWLEWVTRVWEEPPKPCLMGQQLAWTKYDVPGIGRMPYLSGHLLIFNKEDILGLGGFDEEFFLYSEDVEISWRAIINKWPLIENRSIPLFHHAGTTDQYKDGKPTEFLAERLASTERFLRKAKNYASIARPQTKVLVAK